MSIVLEHFNCLKCGNDKFNVILEEKPFNKAMVDKVICTKCGRIYKNTGGKK